MPSFNFRKSRTSGLLSNESLQNYIRPSSEDDAVRTLKSSEAPIDDAQFDPLEAIKAGLPAMRYVAETQQFEWIVLKCDERLNFLYALKGDVDLRETSLKDLYSVKLDSILQVLNDDNAVAVYNELGISGEHMSRTNANVIKFGAMGSSYSLDNTILLIAGSRQQVRRCVEAAISNAPNQDKELDNAARYVQSHVRTRALRTSVKEAGSVLANINLKDTKVLSDLSELAMVFELTFQQAKDPVEITLSAESDDLEGDATRAAEDHKLNHADTARLVFTVEECHAQRKWLAESSVIKNGLFSFLLEATHNDTPLVIDDSFKKIRDEITSVATKSHAGTPDKQLSVAIVRSHFRALAQCCELEERYADLCTKSDSDRTEMSIAQIAQVQQSQDAEKQRSADVSVEPRDSALEDSIQRDMRELKVSPSPKAKRPMDSITEKSKKPDDGELMCPCSGSRRSDGPCSGDCGMQ